MSALATVARKNFIGKFLQKLIFRSGILCYTCADAHGSLKSLHTLFDTYLDRMLVKFEKKSYGPNHTKFSVFGQKMVNKFWQSVDAILANVSVTETIVWC